MIKFQLLSDYQMKHKPRSDLQNFYKSLPRENKKTAALSFEHCKLQGFH